VVFDFCYRIVCFVGLGILFLCAAVGLLKVVWDIALVWQKFPRSLIQA